MNFHEILLWKIFLIFFVKLITTKYLVLLVLFLTAICIKIMFFLGL